MNRKKERDSRWINWNNCVITSINKVCFIRFPSPFPSLPFLSTKLSLRPFPYCWYQLFLVGRICIRTYRLCIRVVFIVVFPDSNVEFIVVFPNTVSRNPIWRATGYRYEVNREQNSLVTGIEFHKMNSTSQN